MKIRMKVQFCWSICSFFRNSAPEDNSQNIPKKSFLENCNQKFYSWNLPYPYSWEFSKSSKESFFKAPLLHSCDFKISLSLLWQNLVCVCVCVNHKVPSLREP